MTPLLQRLAALAALAFAALAAQAAYPDKPVKIMIGFPAGGPLDAHARLLAERLGQVLAQPVIIDYKAGVGGTVGAEFVAKSAPDGYTLLMANTGTMVINPAEQGKLRALAVTGKERNAALPDVPTFAEAGISGLDVVGFYGLLAPAGTPKDVVAKLSDALRQVLETPDIRNRMAQQGADPADLSADPFQAYLTVQMPVWAKAVKDSGTKLD